ncbi:MAG: DUF3597 domain-containing protein, partial [Alphaproteobacteria bacterium]
MGWFETIMGAIFGSEAKAEEVVAKTVPPAGVAPPAAAPTAPAAAVRTATAVDVAAVLDKAVAAKGQKLDWRRSIVDLLKAIDVDSSFKARKELAAELGYTGSTDDSATMNIWLHKQV